MKSIRISETIEKAESRTCYENSVGYNVAVVIPRKPVGGVKRTIDKLIKGLNLEGFCVKPLEYSGKTLLNTTFSDIRNVCVLRGFDAVIYTRSIPLFSHVFIHNYVKTILFIHGFVKDELLNVILRDNLKGKIGATYLLTLWNFSKSLNKIDLYICRSPTSCEVNMVKGDYIILPEFVFEEEVRGFEEFVRDYRKMHNGETSDTSVRVVTYTSYASSPRLLEAQHVERLMKIVSKYIDKKIELVIIDPKRECRAFKLAENVVVRYLKPLLKKKFHELILNSDLYIELNIDEELRNSTIEAGLLETPIAKLTHPKFKDRKDYPDEVLINGYSFEDLAMKLVLYLNEYLKDENHRLVYTRKFKNFIAKCRTWDSVKKPLIEFLKS